MLAVRPTIDTIVNSAVLVVCLIVGVNAALQLADRLSPPPDPGYGATYRAGDLLPALQDYSYSNARATLVLAVRSTCGFCTQSMPFYSRIVDAVARSKGAVHLIAVSTESEDVLRSYFETHDVKVDSFESSQSLRIAGTPTLLLADSKGVVQDVWVGRLDDSGEAAVLNRLERSLR